MDFLLQQPVEENMNKRDKEVANDFTSFGESCNFETKRKIDETG